MKKLGFVFALMVCVCLLLGADFSGTGYTLDYKGWFKSAYPGIDGMFLTPKNSTGTYHENVSIIIVPQVHKGPIDWEAVKVYQVNTLKKMASNFKLKRWEAANLGTLEARFIECSGKYAGVDLIWLQYYTYKNGKWYIITYTGEKTDYGSYVKEAESIIESFSFK
ncbi:MAG: hypothetical protein GY754_20720 [bacterium]|nr:hypothetical protein [bacterium]